MCGITGWTDWSRDLGEQRSILERMTRTLAPRGPDAEGLWLSRHALLGHRRLAIIDLENGAQPMLAEAGGRVALTYSGEVYNFRELRAELETLGQVFRTRSDTEVVLRAYLQWGEASFARLRGIYGFALWDEREQSLWLVRDRFGVKPLYYYPTAGGVLFASEPKAIFANPEANPVLDASGIAELFALTTAPTPGHGLYKGLRQVRPGQALRFDRNGVRELVYWALRAERHEEGAEDSAERAGQLLREAVAEQLVADVPLGSLLSGGLDSSAISAFAVAALDGDARRLPTFSVDFPGEGRGFVPTPWQSSWDEPYAQLAANFLGTPHRTVLVAPEEVLEQDEAVLQARACPAGASWTPRSTCCSARSASTPRWRCRASRPTRCSAATRSSTTRAPSHTTASPGWPARAGPGNCCGGRSPSGWRRRNTSGRATARPSPKCRDWMARMPPSGASARSPTWR